MKSTSTKLIFFFALLAVSIFLSAPGVAQGVYSTLYWPNFDISGTLRQIESINVNGTGRTIVVSQANVGDPTAVEVDPVAGKIYWHDQSPSSRIRRANLNGTGVETFVASSGFASTISLDPYHGKIYWPNFDVSGTLRQIERINLDGTGREIVIPQASAGEPIAIKVDGLNEKIYWFDQANNRIMRANLDGTGITIFVAGSGFASQIDIDPVNGKMYWPNFDVVAGTGRIESINLDGTGRGIVIPQSSAVDPVAITLDVPNGKIYWYTQTPSSIRRANLNGTSVETFIANPGYASTIVIPKQMSGTLPLRLLSFSGKEQENHIRLVWATAAEVNTESFSIERSQNPADFRAIGSVAANAASGQYNFTDAGIASGQTYYYRLKMLDIGGAFTYSPTIQVQTGSSTRPTGYRLFPNPVVSDVLYLQALNGDPSPIRLRIVDLQGRIILQGSYTYKGDRFEVRVANLPKGQFVLQVATGESAEFQSLKFVK
jgi:hypothetical protein